MNSLDCLLLDAKQAILDEQHRRFQALQREGKQAEAMQQFQTTMCCASDLLNESLRLLERMIQNRPKPPGSSASETPPSR